MLKIGFRPFWSLIFFLGDCWVETSVDVDWFEAVGSDEWVEARVGWLEIAGSDGWVEAIIAVGWLEAEGND